MRWFALFALAIHMLYASEKNIEAVRSKLKDRYEKALLLKEEGAPEETYKKLLEEINQTKQELVALESSFKKSELKDEWGYWDTGEVSIGQLVMEYGSCDFLYVIPKELKEMKLQLFSMVSIDRTAWDEMLELILSSNGIGVRPLNSYAKQLFLLKSDATAIHAVIDKAEDLQLVPDHKRVLYVLSPKLEQLKQMQTFFEKFSDIKQTSIQAVGTKIVLVSTKQNIERLLSVYQAVWENNEGKTIKVVPLSKVAPLDAEKVLKSFFSQVQGKPRPSFQQSLIDELQILNIPQGVVFIGEKKSVNRAEKILLDLEEQLSDPKEMMVFWYQCSHTDPEDLSQILEKVYDSLTFCSVEKQNPNLAQVKQTGRFLSNRSMPPASKPDPVSQEQNKTFKNFIVDPKLGGIMMVIRRDKLSEIEDLLTRLDVPKKMVEIDVLLVEKKIQDRTQTGINLLKIGGPNTRKSSISFDTDRSSPRKGILDFILSKPKGRSPAFDFTFSLLLAQEDIQIHANPSVLATNQTPATISIVEEISINNGAVPSEGNSQRSFEKSFTRAQYGTTIIMTPMIHETEEKDFVTLQTNITFDTTQMSQNDRPPVTKRHVENEVRVADGETIIIGGLSRKTSESSHEKIPFLGNLPGIGKMFGTKITNDSNTEMFIFITPKIVKDPTSEMQLKKRQRLLQRPGDIPEFLEKMEQAKALEKKHLFKESIQLLFDRF